MILLWLLKIKSVITSVITFIIEHWQVFLVLAILCTAYYYKTAYEREKHAYEVHLLADMKAFEVRQAENKVKADAVAAQFKKQAEEYQAELARYKLNADREAKNLKDNLNAIQDILNRTRTGYEFRLQTGHGEAAGLREVPVATDTSAQSERDSNAVASLVRACQLTTLQYQQLYDAWVDACAIHGCE